MKYMKEIMGPDERCTNVAFESFGVCVNYKIIDGQDIQEILEKNFKKYYEYVYKEMDYVINKPSLSPLTNEFSNKLGKRILDVKTIKQLVFYLKKNKIFGHYYIWVSGHVLAIHYLKNGKMYIVDTEEKFISNKRIITLISIEDFWVKDNFLNFLQNNKGSKKILIRN